MKRFFGFSLAEALITLLVVSIIVIATIPVITKKKRNLPSTSSVNVLWTADRTGQGTIYPSESRDIKLGEIKDGFSQGIVVVGTLEFKDKKGRTIGWIKENGENSFNNTAEIMQKQQEIINMLNGLSTNLQNAINAPSTEDHNSNYDSGSNYGRKGRVNGGMTGRERLNRRSYGNEDIDTNITPEQMQRIAEVQKQLEAAMSSRYQ